VFIIKNICLKTANSLQKKTLILRRNWETRGRAYHTSQQLLPCSVTKKRVHRKAKSLVLPKFHGSTYSWQKRSVTSVVQATLVTQTQDKKDSATLESQEKEIHRYIKSRENEGYVFEEGCMYPEAMTAYMLPYIGATHAVAQ